MNNLILYVRESFEELRHKVTWPSWADLQSNAIVVLVASLIIALLIFGMDYVSKFALGLLYGTV